MKSHAVPLQLGVAFAGVAGQPAHTPAQRRKPELHDTPHEFPSQVATPLPGVLHALHEEPHVAGELFATH